MYFYRISKLITVGLSVLLSMPMLIVRLHLSDLQAHAHDITLILLSMYSGISICIIIHAHAKGFYFFSWQKDQIQIAIQNRTANVKSSTLNL